MTGVATARRRVRCSAGPTRRICAQRDRNVPRSRTAPRAALVAIAP